jgi:hypothetical protein
MQWRRVYTNRHVLTSWFPYQDDVLSSLTGWDWRRMLFLKNASAGKNTANTNTEQAQTNRDHTGMSWLLITETHCRPHSWWSVYLAMLQTRPTFELSISMSCCGYQPLESVLDYYALFSKGLCRDEQSHIFFPSRGKLCVSIDTQASLGSCVITLFCTERSKLFLGMCEVLCL